MTLERRSSHIPNMKPARIAMSYSASGGWLNIGDTAMVQNIVARIKAAEPETEIICLSENPDSTLDGLDVSHAPSLSLYCDHDGILVKTAYRVFRIFFRGYARRMRNSLRAVKALWFLCNAGLHASCGFSLHIDPRARRLLSTIQKCDMLWASGGGYIVDQWFWGIAWRMLITFAAFKWHRKSVILTGQQVGPLTGAIRRRLVGLFLDRCADALYVRDTESADLLGALGIDAESVNILLDDAGTIPAVTEREAREILRAEVPDIDDKFIAANYRIADYNGLAGSSRELAKFLDFVIEQTGMDIVFVPLSYAGSVDDRVAAKEVVSCMANGSAAHVLSNEYNPQQIKGIIGLSNFAVGVSHHFAVFSLMTGVPTLCVYASQYYAHKFRGLIHLFGCPDLLARIDDLNSVSKREMVLEMVQSYDGVRDRLKQTSQRLSNEWEEEVAKILDRISQA